MAGQQARIWALLGLKPERCLKVALETGIAKLIGYAIGECGHADVVDTHAALVARDHHAAVITSDAEYILKAAPGLHERIVMV